MVAGTEPGKLSNPRRHLYKAIALAHKHEVSIILVRDVSRLLRSESFDARTNPKAQVTPEEFAALLNLAGGLRFATIVPPNAPYELMHGEATRWGLAKAKSLGRLPGPRPSFDEDQEQEFIIAQAAGMSMTEIRDLFAPGCHPTTVWRHLKRLHREFAATQRKKHKLLQDRV
jgi:DNA invertase Pin-like site-specific DNA recombinase